MASHRRSDRERKAMFARMSRGNPRSDVKPRLIDRPEQPEIVIVQRELEKARRRGDKKRIKELEEDLMML